MVSPFAFQGLCLRLAPDTSSGLVTVPESVLELGLLQTSSGLKVSTVSVSGLKSSRVRLGKSAVLLVEQLDGWPDSLS